MVMVRPYLVMVKALEDRIAHIKRLQEEKEELKRKLKESHEKNEKLQAQLAEKKEELKKLNERIEVLKEILARRKKEEMIKFVRELAVSFSIGAGICLFVELISNLRKK